MKETLSLDDGPWTRHERVHDDSDHPVCNDLPTKADKLPLYPRQMIEDSRLQHVLGVDLQTVDGQDVYWRDIWSTDDHLLDQRGSIFVAHYAMKSATSW